MILILDREAGHITGSMLEMIATLPDGTPIHYHVGSSGQEAWAWLRKQPLGSVRMVITGRYLRHKEDGLRLIPEWRRSPALTPDAIVIVYSSMDDSETIQAARFAGVDGFVARRRALTRDVLWPLISTFWEADSQRKPRPWIVIG